MLIDSNCQMELEKAKQILNGKTNEKYNEKELIQILEFINVIAVISINNQMKKKQKEDEKCNSLR